MMTDSETKNAQVVVVEYLTRINNSLSGYRTPQDKIDVRQTEVIEPIDPRTKDPSSPRPFKRRLETYCIAVHSNYSRRRATYGSNVLTIRYVLPIKSNIDG